MEGFNQKSKVEGQGLQGTEPGGREASEKAVAASLEKREGRGLELWGRLGRARGDSGICPRKR